MKNNDEHLKETAPAGIFTEWQEVDVEIYAFVNLGIRVVINDEYWGLVYGSDLYDELL
jgi:predicted RNA-binding protein (virulence factor B family)